MKRIILAAALSLSASAFANICQVDMVDNRGRFMDRFTAYDYNDNCKEGMKACRLEIRKRRLTGLADCLREDAFPTPIPTPVPTPFPTPIPRPYPEPIPQPYPNYEVRRPVSTGESVVYNSNFYTVIGVSFNGTHALKDSFGYITNNVRRESISITHGCNLNLCTQDSVIDITSSSYKTVTALSFDDRFILKDSYQYLTAPLSRSSVAETKGCVFSRYAQLCVGSQVINSANQYTTVVGIQLDGRVVLKDAYGYLRTNVDPSSLVITR